jgi:hypothetical protein
MAKINNTRAVYQKISELKGTRSVQADRLRNVDGTVVHGSVERKERWMRHFKNLLNVESRVENGVHTFEGPRENRNEEAPTEEEVNSAIKQLKSHKAPGFDNINSEARYGSPKMYQKTGYGRLLFDYSRRKTRASATTGEA